MPDTTAETVCLLCFALARGTLKARTIAAAHGHTTPQGRPRPRDIDYRQASRWTAAEIDPWSDGEPWPWEQKPEDIVDA